ncbi:MAG: TetR/AcrR family transcriptional regulator [Xanthomonadales bacterium]|nr:TetR/AcrR family transcriptional regulator [Xanthomonadales bacterium]
MPRPTRRQHLIEVAIDLFNQYGYHATGIDLILEKAKVSKRTLYVHFRSKDELILAALRHYDGLFRNHFMTQVEKTAKTPVERLLAVYQVAQEWFMQNNFYGCMFINAIGEYSATDSAIRQVCKEFKALIRDYIEGLCAELAAPDPAGLAEELGLLFEGAIVTAQVSQQKSRAAQTAKTAATALIDNALAERSDRT